MVHKLAFGQAKPCQHLVNVYGFIDLCKMAQFRHIFTINFMRYTNNVYFFIGFFDH